MDFQKQQKHDTLIQYYLGIAAMLKGQCLHIDSTISWPYPAGEWGQWFTNDWCLETMTRGLWIFEQGADGQAPYQTSSYAILINRMCC